MKQLFKARYLIEVTLAAEDYDDAKTVIANSNEIYRYILKHVQHGPSTVYRTNHIPVGWSIKDIPFNEDTLTFQDYMRKREEDDSALKESI